MTLRELKQVTRFRRVVPQSRADTDRRIQKLRLDSRSEDQQEENQNRGSQGGKRLHVNGVKENRP